MASSLNGTGVTFSDGSTQSTGTSGDFKFNSGYGSVVTAYGCRAWVNFNGTGTVAIRASGNVSSITDNGTGNYYANFTTAMPDLNFSVGGVHNWTTNGNGFYAQIPDSTANAKVQTLQSNANIDCTFVSVFVFR